MAKAFTSGENTADKRGERNINSKGLGILIVGFLILLAVFILFMTGLVSFSGTPGGGSPSAPPSTETSRPQQP